MRAVLHILAVLVLLPYLALAAGFLIIGHAISGGSLLSFFEKLLTHATWIVPWGVIGAGVVIVVLTVLGILSDLRWLGALLLSVLAAVCLAVILVVPSSLPDAGQILFLAPCAGVLAFSAWLWRRERRSTRC